MNIMSRVMNRRSGNSALEYYYAVISNQIFPGNSWPFWTISRGSIRYKEWIFRTDFDVLFLTNHTACIILRKARASLSINSGRKIYLNDKNLILYFICFTCIFL